MTSDTKTDSTAAQSWIQRLVTVHAHEWRAALLGFGFFFTLLASYFILRSIRDALGVQAGIGQLPYLFLGTLIATIALQPVLAILVARIPIRRAIPIVYRTFAVCMLVFAGALRWWPNSELWLAPVFFIWTSVFNLFVVSVFWGFMSDSFQAEQGKRLYGFISVGGTLGAIAGSGITALLATTVGTVVLLIISAGFLEGAVWCVRLFPPSFRADTRYRDAVKEPVGGGVFTGITHVLRSPYLAMICVYMLIFTIGTTVLYFQQAEIVKAAYASRDERTAFLARVDLTVQILTVFAQLFLTGRVIKWLGVGVTLSILPVLSIVGFSTLGMWPTLAAFVAFNVLRRAGNYAFASPGREVLYTVVSPEDKYKAKNFIDTAVYRSGDQIGAWSYATLSAAGLAVGSIALLVAPLSAVWLFVAIWLGRRQRQMQADEQSALTAVPRLPVPERAPLVSGV